MIELHLDLGDYRQSLGIFESLKVLDLVISKKFAMPVS
jgi:hypothetical protein